MVQTLRRAAVIVGNSTTELPQGDVLDGGAPPGAVDFFAMSSAPAGYLKANGAAVSRTAYPNLYAAIGSTFGAGDGSTTFNLPDLRGQFPRAWADNGSLDSGRAIGSAQAANLPTHQHTTPLGYNSGGVLAAAQDGSGNPLYGSGVITAAQLNIAFTSSASGSMRVGLTNTDVTNPAGELRPANVALLACIKF